MTVGGLKVGWFCTALVSIVCSALSKEQGITAAAICLAYDALYNIKVCCPIKKIAYITVREWSSVTKNGNLLSFCLCPIA